MNNLNIFLLLMIPGTVLLGVNDIQWKHHLNLELDEQVVLFLPMLIAGLGLFIVSLIVGFPEIKSGFWAAFATTGILNVLAQSALIYAFKHGEASEIAPLRLLTPPLVVITGYLFLGEKISNAGLAGIIIAMIGLGLLLNFRFTTSGSSLKSVLFGIFAAVVFSVSFVFDKKSVLLSSATFFSGLIYVFVSVGILIGSLFYKRNFYNKIIFAIRTKAAGLIYIAITSGLGYYLTVAALKFSEAAYASSLKRLQAFWTILLSGRFLKEKGLVRKFFAAAIMLAGIVISLVWK